MKEGTVYKRLDRKCIHSRIERIENRVKRSTPDMHLQTRGYNCWIEAKDMHIGVRDREIRVPYEEGQYDWAKKEVAFGGNVLLGIVVDDEPMSREGIFFSLVPREYISREEFLDAYERGMNGFLAFVKNSLLDEFFISLGNGTYRY
jgi:hypothetical protein